jgi:glycosyltransferase involved in cell wall biosynthesis
MSNLVVLATSYPSHAGDAAGHFVRAECLNWVAEGHRVTVLAPDPWSGDQGLYVKALGGEQLFSWPGAAQRVRKHPERLLGAIPFWWNARWHVRQLQPDKIVAHWLFPTAWPVVWSADSTVPLEIVCHGADIRFLVRVGPRVRRVILGFLQEKVVTLRFASESLRSHFLDNVDIDQRSHWSSLSEVQKPTIHLDIVNHLVYPNIPLPFWIGLGRLIPGKRYDLAIAALAYEQRVHLVLVGDGPERLRLEQLAHQHCPGRVHFLGKLDRQQALAWLRQALVLVHPSEQDEAPTCILEARALGVPVVATKVGDVPRWSELDLGIKIVERNAHALARAASSVFRTSTDLLFHVHATNSISGKQTQTSGTAKTGLSRYPV